MLRNEMPRYGIYAARKLVASSAHVDMAMHQCNVEAYYNRDVTHIVVDRIRNEIVYMCDCCYNFYYSMDKGRTWTKIFHDDIEDVLDI